MILIQLLFDNDHLYFKTSEIQNLSLDTIKNKATEKKEVIIERFHKTEFKTIATNTKYVFLTPLKIIEKLDFNEIIQTTKK